MEKETAKAVSFCIISPSVKTFGFDTSLAEGRQGEFRACGRGVTDSHGRFAPSE